MMQALFMYIVFGIIINMMMVVYHKRYTPKELSYGEGLAYLTIHPIATIMAAINSCPAKLRKGEVLLRTMVGTASVHVLLLVIISYAFLPDHEVTIATRNYLMLTGTASLAIPSLMVISGVGLGEELIDESKWTKEPETKDFNQKSI